MISVDEAKRQILSAIAPLGAIEQPLIAAAGYALAEPVRTELDLPPFTNSAMDGFAVRSNDLHLASGDHPIRLPVIGRVLAGESAPGADRPNAALRIMTGAMVPAFYDAVIPFEAVVQPDAASIIVTAPVASGSNIRLRGEDVRIGDHLLDPGDLLSPVRIGLLAAIGRDRVLVHARPRVAILSTGDELASAAGVLSSPARIHDSNGPMLAALVQHAGGDVVAMMRIGDDPDTLRTWLNQLDSVDFIISTGGISAGDSDYLHNLSSPDVQLDFWQVAIRPGKPLGFGHVRSRPWLALPGNPGAAAVSFWQFGWPALRTLGGHRQVDLPIVPARLTASIENRGGRRAFVRAHLEASADGFIATPIGKSGSGMIGALAQANALIIILEARDHANAGDMCSVQRID